MDEMKKKKQIFYNFIKALFKPSVKKIEISLIGKDENKIATVTLNAELFK